MIRAALVLMLVMGVASAVPQSHAEEVAPGLLAMELDPHPGARLPLGTVLHDESGRDVTLGMLANHRPAVLVFDYFRCKTICGLALANLADAAAALARPPLVLAISIDPRDTPAEAAFTRAKYPATAEWRFLTGPENAVRPLAEAAGFHYRYDAGTDQYIHSAGTIVLAADGTVSSYLPALELTSEPLEAALTTAAQGKTVAPLTRLLLLCFGGGAPAGRYTSAIELALILLNLGGMAGAIAVFARRMRRREAGPR